MAKNKQPAFLFYWADYLADTKSLNLEEHGAWILIILEFQRFKDRNLGKLSYSLADWARILGCDETKAEQILMQLKAKKICDVTFCHKKITPQITVMSRRINREEKERILGRERQKKYRGRNANVTPKKRQCNAYSSFSSSSSNNNDRDDNISLNHNSRYISVTLEKLGYSKFQSDLEKTIDELQAQETNPIDWGYYLERFLKPGLSRPDQYFRKCMGNEEKPWKLLPQPPQKKFTIPLQYQIIEGKSLCLNCRNYAQKILTENNIEGLFCEYCGNFEEESTDEIPQVIEKAKEILKNEQEKVQTIGNESC